MNDSPSPEYYEPPDIDDDESDCYTDCRECRRGRHEDCELKCHD